MKFIAILVLALLALCSAAPNNRRSPNRGNQQSVQAAANAEAQVEEPSQPSGIASAPSNSNAGGLGIKVNPKLDDSFRDIPDFTTKETLEILKDLSSYFFVVRVKTGSKRFMDAWQKIKDLERKYRQLNNPLLQEHSQVATMAQIFVIAVNAYTDTTVGTQSIYFDVVAKARDRANDDRYALAFVGGIAINMNCNQFVHFSAEAKADIFAKAEAEIDVHCEYNQEDDDFRPFPCLNQERAFCCREIRGRPNRRCLGYTYDSRLELLKEDATGKKYCDCTKE